MDAPESATRKAALPLTELFQAGDPLRPRLSIDRVLSVVRKHLGMSVAFVAEFREHDRIFRHVDAEGAAPIDVGDTLSLDDGYCRKVVDGTLPELIPDTALVPAAMAIPATATMPIGAHLSVPIRLADGTLYGTFCCFAFHRDPTLTERDLGFMRAFADLLAECLELDSSTQRALSIKRERIRAAVAKGQPTIVFQPIYNVSLHRIEGFECLSRFHSEPIRSADQWFNEAWEVGLGLELELMTLRNALHALTALPSSIYLAVNCSPQVIASGQLPAIVAGFDARRVVIEITEHQSIDDYAALRDQMRPLRKLGVRFAIDDTGAGYASLRHVLHLDPDKIKLDMALTRGIDRDVKRRALAAALIAYARQTGGRIVAEGVETPSERESLVALGVDCLQGFLIGRPATLAQSITLLATANVERTVQREVELIREA